MVGVGQLALPVLGGRQFGAVPADDVGEHVGGFPPVRGLLALRFGGQAFADLVHPLGPGQFRRRPWPGLRVRLGWRGRHHPRVVRVGAPGHRRVQPLAVLVAGDHGDPGLALPALGGVRGAGVGGVEVLERGVADLAAEHRLPGPRVTAGGLADPHPPVVLDRLDPHHVAVGQPGLVVVDPVDHQVTHAGTGPLGQRHRPPAVDHAEAGELVTDPASQLPHMLMGPGHQDDVGVAGQQRHRHLRGALEDLLRAATDHPALLVILVSHRRVPSAQAQGRVPLPRVVEPDRLGQLQVTLLAGLQPHRAALLDGLQLLLIPSEKFLAARPCRQALDRRRMPHRQHRRLVNQNQRPGPDDNAVPVSGRAADPVQELGGVQDTHLPQFGGQDVAGCLGGRRAIDVPHPGLAGGGRGGGECVCLPRARGPGQDSGGCRLVSAAQIAAA